MNKKILKPFDNMIFVIEKILLRQPSQERVDEDHPWFTVYWRTPEGFENCDYQDI